MRKLVVVSGYYGFGNLGDEAILEQITDELKRIVNPEEIVVLSANPSETAAKFGVRSQDRLDALGLLALMKRCRLFISGGGGLFQDTHSLGSVVFYGAQILMASQLGASVVIYAQGIGPLSTRLGRWITRQVMRKAAGITVRDRGSYDMLRGWNLQAEQTADPVWCLNPKPLPDTIEAQLANLRSSRLIGISLRPSPNFNASHLQLLIESMKQTVPAAAHLLLMPLQAEQDTKVLRRFADLWSVQGSCESTLIDTSYMIYPSQWISLLGRCQLLIGMRLHALIMALNAGVGVVGVDYDPKVSQLLTDSEQPCLNLAKERQSACSSWRDALAAAMSDREKLSSRAIKKAEGAKKLACQNFNLLARILDLQKQ